MDKIKFSTFPRTITPKSYALKVVEVFENHFEKISTIKLIDGLDSDTVLRILRNDLENIGFDIEKSKKKDDKIYRPVFYGENARPSVQYEIDGFNKTYGCGIEVEAGRAWMGNAVQRDLIQGLGMVDLKHLIIAVPIAYKYKSKGRSIISKDYEKSKNLIDNIYSHSRFRLPYDLTLIGY